MKRSNQFLLVIGVIVVLCLIAGGLIFLRKHAQPIPNIAVNVSLSPVTIQDIPIVATATGTLVAKQTTNISPKVPGYVMHILFQDGQFTNKGTVLIKLDTSKEIDDLAAARAESAMSRLQYERDKKAYQRGLILQSVVYQDKVTNKKDQALVNTDQTALNNMNLVAPFSGYLGARTFSIGDYVTAGEKLVSLVDKQHLKVIYSLPSFYSPVIKLGQKVTITADFLPNLNLFATVSFIAPNVDPDSQTIAVQATLDNSRNKLKPGQFVNIKQTLGVKRNVILVPENSVQANLSGHYVFMVKNNKAIAVHVKLGQRIYGKVQIITGLKPDDKIITQGQLLLKNGNKVNVVHARTV